MRKERETPRQEYNHSFPSMNQEATFKGCVKKLSNQRKIISTLTLQSGTKILYVDRTINSILGRC